MVRWSRNPGVMEKQVDGELILFDPLSQRIFCLNATGNHVWEGLHRPAPYDDLLDSIVKEFDVAEDSARADLDGLLHALSERGLVVSVDS